MVWIPLLHRYPSVPALALMWLWCGNRQFGAKKKKYKTQQTSSASDRVSLSKKCLSRVFFFLGTKKKEQKQQTVSEVKLKPTPHCADSAFFFRSGRINKYLSGSNRERSVGGRVSVPEQKTKGFRFFFKKLVRKKSLNTVCIKIPIHSRHKCCALLITSGKHTESYIGLCFSI